MSLLGVTLALLASISGATLDDSVVHVPIKQFRKAVEIIVDDSLCKEQVLLQDSLISQLDTAYKTLRSAYSDQSAESALLREALKAADKTRKENLAAALDLGTRYERLWLALKVAVPVSAVIGLLLGNSLHR